MQSPPLSVAASSPGVLPSAPPEAGRLVRRAWSRLNLALFLEKFVSPAALALGATAIALAAARWRFGDKVTPWILAAAAAVLVVLAIVIHLRIQNRRGYFSAMDAAAVVDMASDENSRLLSTLERPDLAAPPGYWSAVRSNLNSSLLRLRPWYFVQRLVVPLGLIIVSLFADFARKSLHTQPAVSYAAMAAPVRAELQAAAPFLPPQEQEALQKQLDDIAKNPQGSMKEKWEAVESAGNSLDQALANSAAALQSLNDSLGQVSAAQSPETKSGSDTKSDSAAGVQSSLSPEQMQQLSKQLEAAAKNPQLALSREQRDALQKLSSEAKMQSISDEDMAALRKKLKERADALARQCNQPGGQNESGQYGKGGVDRGRGDAPVQYGRNDAVDNPGVKQEKLDDNFLDANHLINLGITPIKPHADPGRFSPAVAQTIGRTQGSVVSRGEISPSQQKVVKNYFQEPLQ